METNGHILGSASFTFGIVPYMNAAPLVHFLPRVAPDARIAQHPPSQLAELLQNGTLDAALVPIVDILSNPDLQILANIGIAAKGPVKSVLILSQVPMDAIRSIRPDPESSTSNRLAQIIMAHHFHRNVEFFPVSAVGRVSDPASFPPPVGSQTAGPEVQPYLTDNPQIADAEILIGDKAMQRSGSGQWQCDLSEAWHAMTGLPFVFAVWATRKKHPHFPELAQIVEKSLRLGQTEIPFIARQQALRLRLPSALCLEYLSRTIHYFLDEQDQLAIKTFQTYCADITSPAGAIA